MSIFLISDVAEYLQVSNEEVESLLDNGTLRGLKIGSEWRIYGDDIFHYIGDRMRATQKDVQTKALFNPKLWGDLISKDPDFIEELETEEFSEGTMGHFLQQAWRDHKPSSDEGQTPTSPATTPSPDATKNRFVFTGDHWNITFQGQTKTFRNIKGIRYIAWLIEHQGKEFSPENLYCTIDPPNIKSVNTVYSNMTTAELDNEGLTVGTLGAAGELLDERAIRELKQQLSKIADMKEIAQETHNTERLSQLNDEEAQIKSYLSASYGHHGKSRRVPDTLKRKSDSVKKNIRTAVNRINEHLPILGEHLKGIHRGSDLIYSPSPRVNWEIKTDE